MLRKLKKIEMVLYWIDDKGDKHEGRPSGLRGDVSRLRGDVDDCSITDKERQNGIDVRDLVG